jgi:hypothetical protein
MTDRAVRLLSQHWAGILFAILIAASVLAPHLIWRSDPRYQGIELMGQDAEEHYIARTEEIYEGHFMLGNTFLHDKDKPYLQPPLGEMIQTGVGKLLFLNVINATLFAKFFFCFLMALTFYALGFAFSKSRIAALIGEGSAMLGHLYMSGLSPWLDLVHGKLPVGSYTLFARPINPEISSLMMFVALLIIYLAFFRERMPRWWEIGAIGLLTGTSLYISPYTFSFLAILLVLACAWFFFKRDMARGLAVLYSGTLSIVALVPFILNYLALRADPGFAQLAQRQGLVADHDPIISIWLVLMAAGAILLWPKAYNASRTFFILMIASLWILTDQNALTGLVLHPSHYHWYITKPLLGLMLGMYAAFVLHYLFKNSYVRAGLTFVLLLVLFYTSPLLHPRWYRDNPDPPVVAAQAYAPVVNALNQLPGGQSVWADPDLSIYIPIYTTDDAPQNPYTIYYLNPQSFYIDSLFLNYRLRGETPATILATLTKERVDVSGRVYGLYYRQSKGDLAAIPDTVLADLADQYKTFYARPYKDIFKELGITLLVAPAKERAALKKIPTLVQVSELEGYTLYAIDR